MVKKNHDIIEVDVKLIHETDKAYLVSPIAPGTTKEVWIPKSGCELGDDGVMQISENMAVQKGMK